MPHMGKRASTQTTEPRRTMARLRGSLWRSSFSFFFWSERCKTRLRSCCNCWWHLYIPQRKLKTHIIFLKAFSCLAISKLKRPQQKTTYSVHLLKKCARVVKKINSCQQLLNDGYTSWEVHFWFASLIPSWTTRRAPFFSTTSSGHLGHPTTGKVRWAVVYHVLPPKKSSYQTVSTAVGFHLNKNRRYTSLDIFRLICKWLEIQKFGVTILGRIHLILKHRFDMWSDLSSPPPLFLFFGCL